MNVAYMVPGMEGDDFQASFNALVDAVGSVSLTGLKLATMGDSQDVSSWVPFAVDILNLSPTVKEAATAGARYNDVALTAVNLLTYPSVNNDNCLSNQVRNIIRDSFTLGAQITWTHPVTGYVTTISTSGGTVVGLGNPAPDIFYIKFGQNGGDPALTDGDFNTVIAQTYGDLDRLNQFSSLRWAIETLSIVFPHATIFVCTPYQSTNSYAQLKSVTDQAIRMAKYMNCPVINMFEELGMSQKFEKSPLGRYTYDGVHPGFPGSPGQAALQDGRQLMARFIAQRMKMYFVSRIGL
jgi:hypothetical protein